MDTIRVDRTGAVCSITLSRPEVRNALSEQMRSELAEVVRELADDISCRVLVLGGDGPSFSAGADLRDRGAGHDDWVNRRHAAGGWQRLLDALEALPQVTVAALHGHVIGGGALLAIACDLRIAARDVSVSIPEVAIGLPLTWAGLPRLVREIGLPRTRDLVLTGRSVGADEALACGLVQRVVDPTDLGAATEQLIDELLAMPAAPLALTRACLSALGRERLAASWADADVLAWTLREPDTAEASRAYRARHLSQRR